MNEPVDLLIIEPDPGGHKMRHVARLLRGAAAWGLKAAVITTAEGKAYPDVAPFRDAIQVRGAPAGSWINVWSLIRLQLNSRRAYQAWARQVRPKRILVPFGDNVDKAFALLGARGGEWELLVMRSFFHHAAMGVVGSVSRQGDKIREWLFRRLIRRRNVRRVLTCDEMLASYATEKGWPGADKIRFAPEPCEATPPGDRAAARARLGLPPDAPVLLLYGAIGPRKGIADALEAFAGDRSEVLMFVGLHDAAARALLEGETARAIRVAGRLVDIDRYVDEATEADAFAAADVVWLGYRDFQGSSGVLVQAARADRPVVACPEGLIGWRTRRYRLGSILADRRPESVRAAFEEALGEAGDAAASERRRAFAEANSDEAFLDAVLAP